MRREDIYTTSIESSATGTPVAVVKKTATAVPVQPAIMPRPRIVAQVVQPVVATIVPVAETALPSSRPSGGGGGGGGGGAQKDAGTDTAKTDTAKKTEFSNAVIGLSTMSGALAGAGVGFLVGKAVGKGIVWFTLGGAALFGAAGFVVPKYVIQPKK